MQGRSEVPGTALGRPTPEAIIRVPLPISGCCCSGGEILYPAALADADIELEVSAHEENIGNISGMLRVREECLIVGFPHQRRRSRARRQFQFRNSGHIAP